MGKRQMIDWVSFTVPFTPTTQSNLSEYKAGQLAWDAIGRYSSKLLTVLYKCPSGFQWSRGRAPYSASWRCDEGVTIYYHPRINNILIEVSGRGCDHFRKENQLDTILKSALERLTRLDFAIDVETDVLPTEIARKGIQGRFKSYSTTRSETGETCYIGSRKSERYLRIYRYNPPHPRHAYLRYEFVSRKDMAKSVLRAYLDNGQDDEKLMAYFGEAFGINHPTYAVAAENIPVHLYRKERGKAGTMLWLTGTVAPAFKSLVAEGVIDNPRQFCEEWLLS
jgi:hypothetical protein